jgi:plastocyanin
MTLALAASAGSSSTAFSAPRAAAGAVEIRTFQFAPDTLVVKVGTRVRWTNEDDIEHTVSAGTPEQRDTRFAGALQKKGAAYEVAFGQSGTFTYFCDRHQFMRGTVLVSGE